MKGEGRRVIRWMSWERLANYDKGVGGMSFQHIHNFNLTMLGMQVWTFLTNPDVISSIILKAKSFSSENFLETSLGRVVFGFLNCCIWISKLYYLSKLLLG